MKKGKGKENSTKVPRSLFGVNWSRNLILEGKESTDVWEE
jgi:hypothetical protein